MTGLEIKAPADAFVGETIDNASALIGINEGISRIGPIVNDEVASTAYSAHTWYSLPATCSRVTEVNIDDTNNTTYTSYRVMGNKILFPDAGTYIIHYLRKPAKLSAITNEPEMHIDYHDSLVTYLKGWFKYKEAIDDDEKMEGVNFMNNEFPAQWRQVQRDLTGKNQARFIPER
jgi:hypothetical protein